MALVLADRVRDTTTTTGIGTVTLSGTAPVGFQNFTIIGSGNTTYYTIHASFQWEVGIGTYSAVGPSLSRDTVLSSSSAGAKVDFLEGVKDVFVTYPSGEAVYQDGSDIKAGTAVLPVANGGTGVTTSTGSGAVVLATSPTLVTPVLGAASATSISNGLGAVGTPSYTFTGDTNTGMWSPAADTLAFSEGGVEAMRIDSSGNVGIGTAAPSFRLDVHDSAANTVRSYCTDATSASYAAVSAGTASGVNSVMYSYSGASWYGTTTNHPVVFLTNNSERMRIDSSGNVGIGTSSPAAKLDIASGTSSQIRVKDGVGPTAYYDFGRDSTDGFFGFSGAQTVFSGYKWSINGGSEVMRINNSGNVGIGTTGGDFGRSMRFAARHDQNAATQVVVINGTSGASAAAQFSKIGGTGNSFVDWALRDVSGVPFDAFEYGSTVGSVRWLFGGTERMRIDNSGNVGIGTSTFGTSAITVIGIANGTAPTTSPAGMGQLYVEGGALKYRGSSGTVTTIANA